MNADGNFYGGGRIVATTGLGLQPASCRSRRQSMGIKSSWQAGAPKGRWDGFMGCWRWRERTQALMVLLERISKLEAARMSTPLAQNALSSRAGGWWGRHYRPALRPRGPNHIKIEKKQFHRAPEARGGDDQNHGALCAPKAEGREKQEGRQERIGQSHWTPPWTGLLELCCGAPRTALGQPPLYQMNVEHCVEALLGLKPVPKCPRASRLTPHASRITVHSARGATAWPHVAVACLEGLKNAPGA
ncbi:hypothetical protein N431DRAFT_466544 [Stipitochalara longipes BDJ]|nr:hypothetical protein N431DRAFT_466544 [Stipitochalara longipes BDJ]